MTPFSRLDAQQEALARLRAGSRRAAGENAKISQKFGMSQKVGVFRNFPRILDFHISKIRKSENFENPKFGSDFQEERQMPGTSAGAVKGWITRRKNEAHYARVLASPPARPAAPTAPLRLDYQIGPQRIRDLYYGGYTPQPKPAKRAAKRTEKAKTAPPARNPYQTTPLPKKAAQRAAAPRTPARKK